MAKYSETKFVNLIRSWFVSTLSEMQDDLIDDYNKINNKDHSNEFYVQNNFFLNQITEVLKDNQIKESYAATRIQYQEEKSTEFAKELLEKFHAISSKVVEYLRSVHLTEDQLKTLSEQYQADPDTYKIYKLDQQYAMQTIESLLVLYSYIVVTGYQIKELTYNVTKTNDGYSYCNVEIPNRFCIFSVSKRQLDDRQMTKLTVNNEPMITDDEIFYKGNILVEKITDIACFGELLKDPDQ